MTLFLAFRYLVSSEPRHRSRVVRIVISTALSLAVTLLVMSVMEYLQEGRIEKVRAVQSFDAAVEGDRKEEMKALFPSCPVFLYKEEDALLGGHAVTVRYIDEDYDGGLNRLSGDFSSLVVPYSLWFGLEGGKATLAVIQEGRSGARLPRSYSYEVSGIYSTPLGRSFDDSHVFLPLGESQDGVLTAVKGVGGKEVDMLRRMGYEVTSWKERESGLAAALALEKTMMYLVLSFLFVIILVSLKSSVRLFYEGKRMERAELEVLGLGKGRIGLAFLLSFLSLIILSLLAGVLVFHLLRPFFSALAGRFLYSEVRLSFPLPVFLSLSAFMLAFTALFCLWYREKEAGRSLLEVIQDAGFTA